MTDKKLRVGVIGANPVRGWAQQTHLPALVGLPDLELAAVCTTRAESAAESASKFGGPQAFHDHQDMLANADLDAVAVVVKVPDHHRLTMDVLDAGLPVYTEWPLGANLEEAQEMADKAREKGVTTMVGLQARRLPVLMRFKELVDDGYVGEVLSASLVRFESGILARNSDRTWQRDKTLGANTLTIAFGHAIDALCNVLGEFTELSAVIATRVDRWHEQDTDTMLDVTSPDTVAVTGTLVGGAVVTAQSGSIPWLGSGIRLEVYGRDGTLVFEFQEHPQPARLRILGGKATDSDLEVLEVPDRLTRVPDTVPQGLALPVAQNWLSFAHAIRTGERVEPDFDTAVQRHRLLDAIQRASDTGQRQTL